MASEYVDGGSFMHSTPISQATKYEAPRGNNKNEDEQNLLEWKQK